MCSTIDVCFMCINDKNCTDVNKDVLSLVEYILPEITIVKLDVNLRICSVCEETVCLFSKFKGLCVENSLLLETTIKEARTYKERGENSAATTTNRQTVEEIKLKPETLPDRDDSENDDDDEDDKNSEGISSTEELKDENCLQNSENDFPYSCRICSRVFKYKGSLTRHMVLHKKYKCYICKKMFADKFRLRNHILDIHTAENKREFQCDKCDKKCATGMALVQHLRTHTEKNKISIREGKYKCGKCIKTFLREWNLLKHLKAHENEDKVKKICYKCNESYLHNNHIRGHPDYKHKPRVKKWVRNRSRVDCPECKRSIRRYDLKDHMESHKGENYKCNVCHKIFAQKKIFKTHMMRNHSGRKFQCVGCNKEFPTSSTLRYHMQTKCLKISDSAGNTDT